MWNVMMAGFIFFDSK